MTSGSTTFAFEAGVNGGVIVLACEPGPNTTCASSLVHALQRACSLGHKQVVVDLVSAGTPSCQELTDWVGVLRAADAAGVSVCIATVDQRLMRVLDLTAAPATVATSVRSALTDFGSQDRALPNQPARSGIPL